MKNHNPILWVNLSILTATILLLGTVAIPAVTQPAFAADTVDHTLLEKILKRVKAIQIPPVVP